MDLSDDIKQDKSHTSEWIESDKNYLSNYKINKEKKEIFLNSSNDYSELKQNYNNTQLKNISIDFGFPNTVNSYKYKRSFPIAEYPIFEQRNTFYYDKDFQLFKNKSVSKYGEGKSKNNNLSQSLRQNRIFSPQHKIITSIKKRKYLDENELQDSKNKSYKNKKSNSKEKDIYELEIINQVIFNENEEDGKSKKSDGKNSSKELKELEEWGEIEQAIFENERDKKNNLLNSIHIEIEKENGEKQLKIVEITKEEKDKDQEINAVKDKDNYKGKKDPVIKIKYTVEDKLCLQPGTPREEFSSLDKDFLKDTSSLLKTNYSLNNYNTIYSLKKHDSSALRKERASEILLKDIKSCENIFSSIDSDKKYFEKRIDIKPLNHKFEKEEQISPIKKTGQIIENESGETSKTRRFFDLIDESVKKNKSIEMDDQYFSKDSSKNKSTEGVIINQKEKFNEYKKTKITEIDGSPIAETEKKSIRNRFKRNVNEEPENENVEIVTKKERKVVERYNSSDDDDKRSKKEKVKSEGKLTIKTEEIQNEGIRNRFKNRNIETKDDSDNIKPLFKRNRFFNKNEDNEGGNKSEKIVEKYTEEKQYVIKSKVFQDDNRENVEEVKPYKRRFYGKINNAEEDENKNEPQKTRFKTYQNKKVIQEINEKDKQRQRYESEENERLEKEKRREKERKDRERERQEREKEK